MSIVRESMSMVRKRVDDEKACQWCESMSIMRKHVDSEKAC